MEFKITYDGIKFILMEVVGTDIINPDKDTLGVLGLDSLDTLDIILSIEKKYKISIDCDLYNDKWTVNQWIEEMNKTIDEVD